MEVTPVRTLSTEDAEAALTDGGVVVVRFKDGCTLRGDNMLAVTDAVIELCGGVKRRMLIDARGMRSADRDARQAPARPDLRVVVDRTAIVVGNPVTRVIASFFQRVVAADYPSRIFTDEQEAWAWLTEGAA